MKRSKKPEAPGIDTERQLAIIAGPNGVIPRLEAAVGKIGVDLRGDGRVTTWADWCVRHGQQAETYEVFLECQMDTDPGALQASLAAATAWLAYAQARAGEAEAFEERIKNRLLVISKNELGPLGEAFARDACSGVKAVRLRWKALAESLREYCWTARRVLQTQPMEPSNQVFIKGR